jgi:hypothetical protein
MNGRVYDPVLARFLSPDPYVQAPDYTQSFNRYSYCWNNPFKYTDPNGKFVWFIPIIVGAAIGGFGYTASVAFSKYGLESWNVNDFWKSVAIGGISGLVTTGIGSAFGEIGNVGHELLRAGAHALANGIISDASGGDFLQGFAAGGLGSLGGSAFQAIAGPKIASSFLGTVGFSALAGGVGAELTGGDFWKGAAIGAMVGLLNHTEHIVRKNFYDKQLKKIYDQYKKDVIEHPGVAEFYESIGGPLGEWAADQPESFQNTCAARLSKALNYSGYEIPKGTLGTYKGGDGKYYFINAKMMMTYLSSNKVWGTPTLLKGTMLNGVIYQTGFSGGVTGHLDVVYRGIAAHEMYDTTTYYWH